jgi:hypothetical protein
LSSITRAVHFAHSTCAERCHNVVRSEPRAWGEGHKCRDYNPEGPARNLQVSIDAVIAEVDLGARTWPSSTWKHSIESIEPVLGHGPILTHRCASACPRRTGACRGRNPQPPSHQP